MTYSLIKDVESGVHKTLHTRIDGIWRVSPLVHSILERSIMYGDFKMDGGMAAPVE